MNKKLFYIILLVVAILFISVGIFLIKNNETSSNAGADSGEMNSSTPTPSTIPIQIDNDTGYSVTANNINSDMALAFLVHSNEDTNQMLKITVNLFNENNEVVFNSEVYVPILGQNYYASAVPYVDENGDMLNVKSAQVQISKQGEYNTNLKSDSVYLDYSNQVVERKLQTKLSLTYQGDIPISNIMGNVVVLKDNQIVALTSFSQETIESGIATTVEVPDITFSGTEKVEDLYDSVLVFINSFGFSTES